MPAIGVDCQLILDGNGYWLEPASFRVARPRVRRADLTGIAADPAGAGTGAGESYSDRGPGKRVWSFIVVAFNGMTTYAGTPVAAGGQQIHDLLRTSYNRVNTPLGFTDPTGALWSVWFDDMVAELSDVRGQVDGCQWYLHVTLVEVSP
jgi:hypothetical protein